MKILILLITFLLTSIAFSEEQKKYDFYWDNIPVVCAAPEEIDRWAEHKGFTPLSISYGREGGKPDGKVVYIITYWVGIDTDETMASVMTPNSNYSCILFRTFDVKLNPGFDFNPKPNI